MTTPIKDQLKIKKITVVELAETLGITRATVYKRFEDGNWNKLQKAELVKLGVAV